MDTKTILFRKILSGVTIALCISLLYACDILENDVTPKDPEVEITGTKIYTLPGSDAYIDLASMIKTGGAVRFDITSQPQKGNLSEVSSGFLQYSSNANIVKARDGFKFSIFSLDNRLLKTDSVVIIIDKDTTNLPCGIYPQNDYYYGDIPGSLIFNVLTNDILCGDSTSVYVEIYRANENYPPYSGSAQVISGNRIQYTPGSSFSGYDKIMYKVSANNNNQVFGYGIVYIAAPATCTFTLSDDEFIFRKDTLLSNTVPLNILLNDNLCGETIDQYTLSITKSPEHGSAAVENHQINYTISSPGTGSVSDSLVYRLCDDVLCKTARVRIELN